jgi:hypothetical protein
MIGMGLNIGMLIFSILFNEYTLIPLSVVNIVLLLPAFLFKEEREE